MQVKVEGIDWIEDSKWSMVKNGARNVMKD